MKITAKWVIDRIEELRNESHISEYRLCELTGITTAGMSSMRKRGTMPKLQTIIKICEELDVTLSEFFKTASEPSDIDYLTDDELKLVKFARHLPRKSLNALLAYAKGLYDAIHATETKE